MVEIIETNREIILIWEKSMKSRLSQAPNFTPESLKPSLYLPVPLLMTLAATLSHGQVHPTINIVDPTTK